MAQNVYDDPEFFAGYSQLRRSQEGLDGAPEWPSLRAMAGQIRGLHVVDLGCGFGWFCRWAASGGAARVLGIDLSTRMLHRARELTSEETVRYQQADLDELNLAPNSFDFAYSSLALHYVRDLPRLLNVVHRGLTPGGRFVFSVEHPVYTAPLNHGWVDGDDGRPSWRLDSYLIEGERTRDWLAPGVVKYHRTFATYLNGLRAAGFEVEHLDEWGPSDAQLAADPALAVERQRPTFLLVAARRL